MTEKFYIIFALFVWFIIGYMIWKIIKYIELKKQREDSIKKSRSIILWETFQTIAPFMKDIPYHPKDMVFVWKWVDYIVFDNLSALNLKQIVFLEIKTWKSQLNNNEKMIKEVIQAWKVKYEVKTLK